MGLDLYWVPRGISKLQLLGTWRIDSLSVLVDLTDEIVNGTMDPEQQQETQIQTNEGHVATDAFVDETRCEDLPHHQMAAVQSACKHGTEYLE